MSKAGKPGSKSATAAAAASTAPSAPKSSSSSSSSADAKKSKSASSSSGAAPAPTLEAWFPKSKRAVLKNGGVVGARPDRVINGITVKEWQRLPRQLLQEYLQQQKRPRCIFNDVPSTPGLHRVRVVIPDPKGKSEKDIKLQTKEEYDSRAEAEEYTSICALKHFTPNLPLEKKFPEVYGNAWKSFGEPNAVVSTANTFTSVHERAIHETEKRQQANEREAKTEKRERKYAQVFMSEANRSFIHDILRHLHEMNPKIAETNREIVEAEEDSEATSSIASTMSIGSASSSSSSAISAASSTSSSVAASSVSSASLLLTQLIALGFTPSDSQLALSSLPASPSLADVLDHLMLTLPEHRLPKAFDPRGKQLEVVAHEKDPLSNYLGHGRFAIPKPVCEAAMKSANENVRDAVGILWKQLYDHIRPVGSAQPDVLGRTDEMVDEAIAEEQTALESIFVSEYTSIDDRTWSISVSGLSVDVVLEILVPHGCAYPLQLPVILIRSEQLSPVQRLQLSAHTALHAMTLLADESPLTFSLHSFLTESFESLLRAPNVTLPASWRGKGQGLSEQGKLALAKMPQASSSPSATRSASMMEDDEDDDADSPFKKRDAKPTKPKSDSQLNARMFDDWTKQKASKAYTEMLRIRQTLPVFKQKDLIVQTCRANQVIVLSGATGSGKSTQLPQFLLDDLLESKSGSIAQVLVTQPRRISAIGLAERVSDERGESCGQSVGYRIRGENKVSRDTKLTFVTTGVLLRMLTTGSITQLSHIVIDEVHERSVEIDFLLLILKQLLPSIPWIKLILMSATLDAEVFSSYFGGCPVLNVEGRTFPVHDIFLEDILEEMPSYSPDHKVRINLKQDELESKITELQSKLRDKHDYTPKTLHTLATLNIHKIDLNCIETLVWYLIDNKPLGGILIFLPGVYHITKLCSMLEQSSERRETREKYWIIPLHGSLSSSNQQRVFAKAPANTRKIVVATNIAETSITVEDILYVIESGRVNQTEYNPENKMSSLVETFVSRAGSNQRRGRAGRVKEGTCYRMYSSLTFNEVMLSHQLPELHRTALDHLCLQVKLLKLDKLLGKADNNKSSNSSSSSSSNAKDASTSLHRVLSQCLQPPTNVAITSAIDTLLEAQALDDATLSLTPLGSHLARLPLDNVRIGKLLLYGALLGCVTSMCRIAAIMSGKPIFNSPSDARDEADKKKMAFATGKSDALTMWRAYNGWIDARRDGGQRAAREFAAKNFLSISALETADDLSTSFRKGLEEIGFVIADKRKGDSSSSSSSSSSLVKLQDDQGESVPVLSAILTAAFYPQVLSVDAPQEQYMQAAHGAVAIEQDSKLFKFFMRTVRDGDVRRDRVFLHPRSINFKNQQYDSPWMTYSSMVQSDDRFTVHDSSIAHPYPLMLFSRTLTTDLEKGLITVDGHIHFKSPPRIASLIRALKKYLTHILESKIAEPKLNIRESPVIEAILRIINTNGF